ncbi:MmcQ/YjbR family DNA-binding protein [Brevibacterium album]|uniref:MmcQ/YjbR family DNA-binding protein n=1 Tax=Brevibacterium album TaxID=417948 RepID=UPI000416EA2E|nr:MmcQ/YjbR family DNA-binding protein [Brevibacterium album]
MDGMELVGTAQARTEELPASVLEHPFGPEWDVYKVCGKVFMLLSRLRGEAIVNLKVRPEDGEALREAFAEITPGYHMNKRHWITVRAGEALDPQLVEDLVTESYLLVVEKLPRKRRPVDPDSFGQTREWSPSTPE